MGNSVQACAPELNCFFGELSKQHAIYLVILYKKKDCNAPFTTQSLATRGSPENKTRAVLQQQKSLVVNYFLIQKPFKKTQISM